MRKDKVLFLRHGLHVHHTTNYTVARGIYLGPPKTKASHTGGTPLPLHGAVAEALAEQLAASPARTPGGVGHPGPSPVHDGTGGTPVHLPLRDPGHGGVCGSGLSDQGRRQGGVGAGVRS